MKSRTTKILRQTRTDFLYFAYSRQLWIIAAVIFVGAVFAMTSSATNAVSAQKQFTYSADQLVAGGGSLTDALAAPATVTQRPDGQTIDNPVRYDFEQADTAVLAVARPLAFVGSTFDLVTFIFLPLLFVFVGATSATADRQQKVLKTRASRDTFLTIHLGKLCNLAVIAAGSSAATIISGLIVWLISRPFVSDIASGWAYAVDPATSQSSLLLKAVLAFAVAFFFAVLGFTVGIVTGTNSWPVILIGLGLFMLPFLGAWDPRNLVAVLGSAVLDFWGNFKLRPPVQVSVTSAVTGLLSYLLLMLAIVLKYPQRNRRVTG